MLHQALKHLRKFHKMRQQELAAKLGISNTYLSEIESGTKAHAITVDLLTRYGAVFDVPVSSIMLFSEHVNSDRRSEQVRVVLASKLLRVLDWIDTNAQHATHQS